jgi:hypothetical protein
MGLQTIVSYAELLQLSIAADKFDPGSEIFSH